MACGTGKTLTGQRIAEQLGSNTTLVLLPSLLLLSKTISDWLTEAKQDFIFLPVCSDSSVTKKIDDQIQTSTSEMGFKTTTDAGEIATFLKRSENKVIFSTLTYPFIKLCYLGNTIPPYTPTISSAKSTLHCLLKNSMIFSYILAKDNSDIFFE